MEVDIFLFLRGPVCGQSIFSEAEPAAGLLRGALRQQRWREGIKVQRGGRSRSTTDKRR